MAQFNGLGMHMGNLARLSTAQTRSISPENFTGGKGLGGMATEDYFCASYNFENRETKQYQEFTTPHAGLHQVIRPDGVYRSQMRFGMYRWHIADPIRFQQDLRVTIQALGWRRGRTYLPLQDDMALVAFWYQTLPAAPFPTLPGREYLELI
jgi:hypothetical protein